MPPCQWQSRPEALWFRFVHLSLLYSWLQYPCLGTSRNASREFLKIWHKCSLGLKNERIWFSRSLWCDVFVHNPRNNTHKSIKESSDTILYLKGERSTASSWCSANAPFPRCHNSGRLWLQMCKMAASHFCIVGSSSFFFLYDVNTYGEFDSVFVSSVNTEQDQQQS